MQTKSPSISAYRKPIVRALPELVELDRIEIVVAERLSYSGLLPKCNIEKLLNEKMDRRKQQEAADRLDKELRMELKGIKGLEMLD